MTLSSVSEGFVLLRNLWEYNSILKYRYKKLKAYKVATMKHLPAPLAKEYKPNLAVRFVKAVYNGQKFLWSTIFSHFRDGLEGMGSLISGESNNDGWTRQEPKLMSTQIDKPNQSDFKFKVGALVRCCKGTMYSLLKDRVYVVKRSWDGGINGNMVDLEDAKDSLERWSLFEKDLERCVESKQEVNEKRKLTHVKRISRGGSTYFTQGNIYKVVEQRVFSDNSWYVKFETNIEGEEHCRFFRNSEGVNPYEEEFELIYDNYENN